MEQTEEYKRLESQLDILEDEFDKEFNSDEYNSYDEFLKGTKELRHKMWELGSSMRLLQIPNYEDLPDCGELLEFETFAYDCHTKAIIPYDGYGYYATKDKMTDIAVSPTDIVNNKYRTDFTHVMWFNK